MRVELHPQRLQSGLHELHPEKTRFLHSGAISQEIVSRDTRGQDREVDDQLVQEPELTNVANRIEWKHEPQFAREDVDADEVRVYVGCDCHHDRDGEVHPDATLPVVPLEVVAADEAEHKGRRDHPEAISRERSTQFTSNEAAAFHLSQM